MRELIIEALSLGVDSDRVQGYSGRRDWEGLDGACAERRRVRREEAEARQREIDNAVVLERSEAQRQLQEAQSKLVSYDLQIADTIVELRRQREALSAVIPKPGAETGAG